jgi:hypothetical protein
MDGCCRAAGATQRRPARLRQLRHWPPESRTLPSRREAPGVASTDLTAGTFAPECGHRVCPRASAPRAKCVGQPRTRALRRLAAHCAPCSGAFGCSGCCMASPFVSTSETRPPPANGKRKVKKPSNAWFSALLVVEFDVDVGQKPILCLPEGAVSVSFFSQRPAASPWTAALEARTGAMLSAGHARLQHGAHGGQCVHLSNEEVSAFRPQSRRQPES